VVTRGATGAAFNAAARMLPATAVAGRGDANGVAAVRNTGGVVGAGSLPYTFVYSPLWFTGSGFTVEQRYADTPLIAGHWLPIAPGQGGSEQAAGQAAVVSGVTSQGGRAVLFGTEPLFRAHPKGLYAEFARALFWASTASPAAAAAAAAAPTMSPVAAPAPVAVAVPVAAPASGAGSGAAPERTVWRAG
jgi:hypothetical protein